MTRLFAWAALTLSLLASSGVGAAEQARVILVTGAPGLEEYAAQFAAWTTNWEHAARQANAKYTAIGLAPSNSLPASEQLEASTSSPSIADRSGTNAVPDREQLHAALDQEPKETTDELWLVFLGHGTYDGKDAKFNLRGPDLTAAELADWLKPFHRPIAVIIGSSSSGPFLKLLSAPGRAIVTSTRSGFEQNYSRFGRFLSEAIANPQADLDKDGQVSLLEAFLYASRQVAEFYQVEGRLATEHALLDDNGDGLGTPADWFRGVRAVKRSVEKAAPDGLRAHQFHLIRGEADRNLSPEQRQRRDQLEFEIAALRDKKPQLSEDEYYRQLETTLLKLAEFYR